MDFFQHHFRRRPKRPKHPTGPAVQTSKARRRSSVGLPSVALVDFRRSSVGLPPVCTDQHRRPSVGMLVASGEKRQSIIELKTSDAAVKSGRAVEQADVKRKRKGFQYSLHARNAFETAPCVHGRLAVRTKCPKVKFIEPHLLGSSMLLASVVQMGRGLKDKDVDDEDDSLSSCSDSNESDDEIRSKSVDVKDLTHIPQPVFVKRARPCSLLRPPRCLRRNSSHLLAADSPFRSSETEYGIYGRYSRRRSSQSYHTVNKPLQTSTTSPSLCHLSATAQAGADLACSGSPLQKSCSSTLGQSEEVIYYDPYLDTWENFLSYVKYNTHTHTHACTSVFVTTLLDQMYWAALILAPPITLTH